MSLFVDTGKIVKVVVDAVSTYSVTQLDASLNEPVLSVHLGGTSTAEVAIAIGNSSLLSTPTSNCQSLLSCDSCVSSRDVYCAWHANKCVRDNHRGLNDVRTGNTLQCASESTVQSTASSDSTTEQVNASETLASLPMLFADSPAQLLLAEPTSQPQVSPVSFVIVIAAALGAALLGLLVGYLLGIRSGISPSTSQRLSAVLGCTIAGTCDLQPNNSSMNIDFNVRKLASLNNLSDSRTDANLYTTSTKPVINIYESVYENNGDDSRADADEDDMEHYADVIQTASSRPSIAMIEETDENDSNSQCDTFLANSNLATVSFSKNDCCSSPHCTLHVPAQTAKRENFSMKLKGLLLRFNKSSADTCSNGATSSSNSSVL